MAALPIPHTAQYLHRASVALDNYLEQVTHASIEELYGNHRDSLYRIALRVTRNADDAEDVVQNVFLRMLRNERQPDLGRCAAPYLKRAATNAAIDLIRKRTQRAETDLPPYHRAAEPTFVEQHHVRQVLGTLPPQNAQLFELHYRGGYLYEELAQRFGLQVGTVKSRLHRIRAALQKELRAA